MNCLPYKLGLNSRRIIAFQAPQRTRGINRRSAASAIRLIKSMIPQQTKPLELETITLVPGVRDRIANYFRDADCKLHSAGEEWTFVGYDFFPYDAGYTIFAESKDGTYVVMRLQDHEQEQASILRVFDQFVAPC